MAFSLLVNTDNEAFSADARAELARILTEAATLLTEGSETGRGCYDINGNRVGSWELRPEPVEEALAAFAERLRLHMKLTRVPARPDTQPGDRWDRDARHYVVTFERPGYARQAFGYSQGSGHRKPPLMVDVLDSLASDAASYLNARNADELAEELDMQKPSEAERLWRDLADNVAKLTALLGRAELEQLAFRTERL